MTEAEYAALTSACDRLLRTPDDRLDRIAIPWLHVLSEHPNNLRHYTEVFASGRPRRRPTPTEAGRIGRSLLRSLTAHGDDPAAGAGVELPAAPVDVLVFSHLLDGTQLAGDDFYFGSLQSRLAEAGRTSLVALRNHARGPEGPLRREAARGGTSARLLLPRVTALASEREAWKRLRREAASLAMEAKRVSGDPVGAGVAWIAARHAVAEGAMANLRLYRQAVALCQRLRPKAVLVTYEGHAWERIVFRAARSVHPATQCIGYQHTILWRRSHAVRRSLGPAWDPDVILTLGDLTRDALAAAPGLAGVRLVTYGSHRRTPAVAGRAGDDASRCLVIPEGLETECLALFDFARSCALRMPQMSFVLRTHPVLPFARVASRHARFRDLPPNIEVSASASIGDDFARCRFALYRGTSAVVHAVLAGVRPFYLERPSELPIDPLYQLPGWRESVRSPEDLAAAVSADLKAEPALREGQREAARAFCARYVVEPRPEALLGVLPA